MAGVFPVDVEIFTSPQGHGYSELSIDTENPFFPTGTRLRGHEFHYSRLVSGDGSVPTAAAVLRGSGCLPGRDYLLTANVLAGYTHLHATAAPPWANGLINAGREFAQKLVAASSVPVASN